MNVKRTAVAIVILLCGAIAAPNHGRAIEVWTAKSECSEKGDFFIYNDTDATVHLESDGWGHTGLLNDPNPMPPYSSKADLDLNLRDDDPNSGTLYLNVTDPAAGVSTFYIWAHTAKHGHTWFTMRSDGDFTDQGTSPRSGAVGIKDNDEGGDYGQPVAQLYSVKTPGYVATFSTCNNVDRDSSQYTGNTMIILTIMRDDPGRFSSGVNTGIPPFWFPPAE